MSISSFKSALLSQVQEEGAGCSILELIQCLQAQATSLERQLADPELPTLEDKIASERWMPSSRWNGGRFEVSDHGQIRAEIDGKITPVPVQTNGGGMQYVIDVGR